MRGMDTQVGWLLLRECLRVQFWVPSYLYCSAMISAEASEHMNFADDTQIYLSCFPSELDCGIKLIFQDIGKIAHYAADNGLKFNLAKSKTIILDSRAFVNRIDISIWPSITGGVTAIPFVSRVCNVGVVMSSNLSWRSHIRFISIMVHFSLHRLKGDGKGVGSSNRTEVPRVVITQWVYSYTQTLERTT